MTSYYYTNNLFYILQIYHLFLMFYHVGSFVLDNHSFVVHSFLDQEVSVKILLNKNENEITDAVSGEKISGESQKSSFGNPKMDSDAKLFEIKIKPHSFRGFRF